MGWLNRIQPLGLLVLRLVLGSIMFAHGYAKVFGGMSHHVQLVQSIGLPGWMAYMSAGAEFIGGALIILGGFTRFAALAVLINLLVAVFRVHWHQGLVGGYEFPLSLSAIAFALIFYGARPISVDWLFGGGKK
jgi:putative oxidoreductase